MASFQSMANRIPSTQTAHSDGDFDGDRARAGMTSASPVGSFKESQLNFKSAVIDTEVEKAIALDKAAERNFQVGFKKILAELVKAKAAAARSRSGENEEKNFAFTRQQCAELLRQQLEEVSYLFDADASPQE